ncbi:MAG: hypothetical protein EPN98_21455 [Phenylobacterium sp.]|uniref:hypothetical protein n=1 Tax=Phenylobacterium sp. TaxID=1871053 RepID=UPI00121F0CF1|nr:hypothetical protein [Phenylobacterium sp.]TAL29012.1 MAG: hypothetical protein EPN98_21455 [Phenylobacterium sp.]
MEERKFIGRVRVTAHSTIDVPYLWQAKRFFPTKGYKELEVLDQEEDPPEIVTSRPNANSGILQDIVTADQDRCGQASYRLILGDPRLGVQETASMSHQIMAAELAASKTQFLKLSGELVDVRGAHARAEAENQQLRVRIQELEALVAGSVPVENAADATPAEARKRRGKTDEKAAEKTTS